MHAVIQLALARHDKEQRRRDTERSAWQEICDESQEQLQQFTTAAGHDLQEPLRTATCFIDLLARRAHPKLDREEAELLGQARAGLSRMNTLLQDLLAYARAGLPQGAPLPSTPAKTALGWAISNLQGAMAESGATITHDVLPAVQADPSQLAQVFQTRVQLSCSRFQAARKPDVSDVKGIECLSHGGLQFSNSERLGETGM